MMDEQDFSTPRKKSNPSYWRWYKTPSLQISQTKSSFSALSLPKGCVCTIASKKRPKEATRRRLPNLSQDKSISITIRQDQQWHQDWHHHRNALGTQGSKQGSCVALSQLARLGKKRPRIAAALEGHQLLRVVATDMELLDFSDLEEYVFLVVPVLP